jgi:hypothetical protein
MKLRPTQSTSEFLDFANRSCNPNNKVSHICTMAAASGMGGENVRMMPAH